MKISEEFLKQNGFLYSYKMNHWYIAVSEPIGMGKYSTHQTFLVYTPESETFYFENAGIMVGHEISLEKALEVDIYGVINQVEENLQKTYGLTLETQ